LKVGLTRAAQALSAFLSLGLVFAAGATDSVSVQVRARGCRRQQAIAARSHGLLAIERLRFLEVNRSDKFERRDSGR
jgi:hypothetical protein